MTVDHSTEVSYETILVPTDGSAAAHEALRHAVSVAQRFDATVYVLTVVDPNGSPLRFGVGTIDELEQAAERLIDELLDVHDNIGLRGTVRRGRPVEVIATVADEIDADLVVMGRSGERTLSDALIGSTADRVLRTVTVPVWLVAAPADDDNNRQ